MAETFLGERSQLADLVVEVGRASLRAGENVVEATNEMQTVAKAHGVDKFEIGVFPTFISYTDIEAKELRNLTVTPDSLDATRVVKVARLIRQAADPSCSVNGVLSDLQTVLAAKTRLGLSWIGYPIASAGFATMLGADALTVLITLLIATAAVWLLQLARSQRDLLLIQIATAFLVSLTASGVALVFQR